MKRKDIRGVYSVTADRKKNAFLIGCSSFEGAVAAGGPGDSIYKAVKIGKIDKNWKYQPIKRRKK